MDLKPQIPSLTFKKLRHEEVVTRTTFVTNGCSLKYQERNQHGTLKMTRCLSHSSKSVSNNEIHLVESGFWVTFDCLTPLFLAYFYIFYTYKIRSVWDREKVWRDVTGPFSVKGDRTPSSTFLSPKAVFSHYIYVFSLF